jgi:hypothetical protein
LNAGGITSTSSTFRCTSIAHSSPLGFVFFLPSFQHSQLRRPFVKQHMKAPSWFSVALRTSLSAATGIFDVSFHTTRFHLSKPYSTIIQPNPQLRWSSVEQD